MHKTKSPIYVIGCLVIGITVLLLVYMLLIFTGIIDVRETRLVIQTGTAEKEYDGAPLSCNTWELVDGDLGIGHQLIVNVNGITTQVGSVPNTATVNVLDAGGNDVTDEYTIELRPGQLSVQGIKLVLRSPTVEKLYDGQPLTAPEWEFVSGRFLPGHALGPVTVSGTITEIGSVPNTISTTVLDEGGTDVSQNYNIVYEPGTLTVKPIALTITSGTMERLYNGELLTCHDWNMTVGTLFPGDTISVEFLRSRLEIGKVTNDIRIVIHDAAGNDVTTRYDIEVLLGYLAVVSEFGDHEDIDGDGIKDILQDFDLDGIPDHWIDTDNDGKPDTPPGASGLNDSDGDGTMDMYEDEDGDGIPDIMQDANSDGYPDHWEDDNGDGIPDQPGIYSNLDDSGKIANDSNTRENSNTDSPAVFVKTDRSGAVYLRYKSYGDYDASTGSWGAAPTYSGVTDGISPLYYSAIAMQSAGYSSNTMAIILNGKQHSEPYYSVTWNSATSDVSFPYMAAQYTINYISFNYVENMQALSAASLGAYSSAEATYRMFVYNSYTAVPSGTTQALESIIQQYQLNQYSRAQLIPKIAEVIQGHATYNKDVVDPEEPCDIVSYFLMESKEGLCRHFASAATLLYRYMGIPARYTGGYYGTVTANVQTALTGENAHAWVEIYMDGLGWMQVEVTGGYDGSDTPTEDDNTGEPPSSDENPGVQWGDDVSSATKIVVQPATITKPYDGTPLTCPRADVECTCDPNGQYSGHTTACNVYKSSWQITSGGLNFGHRIDMQTTGSITAPGTVENWIVPGSVRIYDENNNDVTGQYNIYYNQNQDKPATLNVTQNFITITSADHNAIYEEGKYLQGSDADISWEGTLLDGHSLFATATGRLDKIGDATNTIQYKMYKTVNGEQVEMTAAEIKQYYSIELLEGKLRMRLGTIKVYIRGGQMTYRGQIDSYTGTPLEGADQYSYDTSELKDGHQFILNSATIFYDVGVHSNTPGYTIKEQATQTLINNYYFVEYIWVDEYKGVITISPITLKIKIDDAYAVYDFNNPGQVFTSNAYTEVDVSGLQDGHYIEQIETTGAVSGLGETCDNTLKSFVVRDRVTGANVSKYYKLEAQKGTLGMTVPST